MKYLVIICLATLAINVVAQPLLEEVIDSYFKSETQKQFQEEWAKHKKSIENAVSLTLQGIVGNGNMNIFMQRPVGSRAISKGFYLTDNVIQLLIYNLFLRDTPKIQSPDVTFSLGNNVMRVEGALFRMFIDADYLLYRNKSAITFPGGKDQDEWSPFSFQQVSTSGQVSIIADYCNLVGTTLTKLSGQSVVLGQTSLRVSNCRFSVEVYHMGSGQPPVISPYFSRQQSMHLESLISMRIVDEVLPQLQATMFSYVNTTAVFGENLPKYRHMQDDLFKQSSNYMKKIVRALNKLTVDENQGRVKVPDLVLNWDDQIYTTKKGRLSLQNMTLNGLDTAFSPNSGGPFRLTTISIAEELRFSTLLVQGRVHFENETLENSTDFGIEIKDTSVLLVLPVDKGLDETADQFNNPSNDRQKFQLLGWRTSNGFSVLNLGTNVVIRHQIQHLVSGYLVNEVPRLVIKHVSMLLRKAISNTKAKPLKKKKDDKCKNEIQTEETEE